MDEKAFFYSVRGRWARVHWLSILLLTRNKDKVFVFVDEIQKCPELLDEIHYLIETVREKVTFILTGSSARKLKRVSVNMLAGRAWQFFLFPLTHIELAERFDLDDVLLRNGDEITSPTYLKNWLYLRVFFERECVYSKFGNYFHQNIKKS